MSAKNSDYRSHGRKITATDLAERLLPDLSMNELLIWSPDLFAFTSYIMSYTGAYQLVISPPTGKVWKPSNKELKEWLGITVTKTGKDGKITVETTKAKEHISKWFKNVIDERSANSKRRSAVTERRKSNKYPIRWRLNINTWSKYKNSDAKDYFGSEFITNLSDAKENTSKLSIIKTHIVSNISDSEKYADLFKSLVDDEGCCWVEFVRTLGDEWRDRLNNMSDYDFHLINDAELGAEDTKNDDDSDTDESKPINIKKGEPIKIDKEGKLTDSADGKTVQWFSKQYQKFNADDGYEKRNEELLGILLKYTPPLLLACWAYFYNQVVDVKFYENGVERKLEISDLLCNRDDIQVKSELKEKLWSVAQSMITMHAVADICCTKWGITDKEDSEKKAQWFAEKLLFEKGSMSTINPERGRIMPKRHNPGVGITLRSISSNLGFHRSSVEVVWRKTTGTTLQKRLDEEKEQQNKPKTLSMLLLPFPLDIKAKDFGEDLIAREKVEMQKDYGFFEYNPKQPSIDASKIIKLIEKANEEFIQETGDKVDIIVFPEGALSKNEYDDLKTKLEFVQNAPSLFIAGVRESRSDIWKGIPHNTKEELSKVALEKYKTEIENTQSESEKQDFLAKKIVNFSRNALYCQYLNTDAKKIRCEQDGTEITTNGSYYQTPTEDSDRYELTPKFKQYKHHRWQLDKYQIESYGLSSILADKDVWWESMKVPKRRVSFLNVGNKLTISHLVCEDLARQDPISDLIRHVGPSLVVTLLMDGPQLKNRWSHRYASVLSDDPGCSVISLTSWGMTKRHSSPYGLMSRVVALWSESKNSKTREIELADGAEAILLTLKINKVAEMTADGRIERDDKQSDDRTSVLRLVDVIQIYPN